jgi:branched-chain amino acid transport system permease protein
LFIRTNALLGSGKETLPRWGAAGILNSGRVIGTVLVAAAVLCPLYLSEFKVGLLGLGLAYGLFAVGLDVAWGRTGIISIGHATFFGLGAYGVAIALARNGPPLIGGLFGVVLAGVIGASIAAVGLRRATNPSTMVVLTLAVTLLAEKVARNWWSLTGGSSGLFIPLSLETNSYYWICVAASTGLVALLWLTVFHRPLGNRLTAIRLNDRRAEHLGIPVLRDRVIAFTLSAGISAIAGCLAAPWMSSVSPDRVGILLSTQVLVWVAIGGKATILGPLVGAVAATYGQDALASEIGNSYLLLLGILFVLSVLLVPNGLAGFFASRPRLADTTPKAKAPATPILAGSADILAANGIVKHFTGNLILDGVDVNIKPSEIVCLIGPNGAGKTTFLNILSGAIKCDAGSLTLRGERIENAPSHRRAAAGLARTFQVPSLFPGLTVAEHFILARQEAGFVAQLPPAYARLERDHSAQLVELLSLSDRRSLEIAMALCARPSILLLDEPAAGLARHDANMLAQTLRSVRDEIGCAIVCVEHDMEIVRDLADRVICLHRGQVISEGTMEDVSTHSEVRRAYLGLA